jgi:hypothetical protein
MNNGFPLYAYGFGKFMLCFSGCVAYLGKALS